MNDNATVEKQVFNTLLYYDLFKYPLNDTEIFAFLRMHDVTLHGVQSALRNMVNNGTIFEVRGYYSLVADETLVDRRLRGNKLAESLLPLAIKQGLRISKFPFIRCVMASGSLSKNYMDDQSDLDFFIVTSSGRLWIARTLLILYKRVFLFNSHKHFCVNYFIDESHLTIEERNLFTATELATVIPLVNYPMYERLIRENGWLSEIFPNFIVRPRCGERFQLTGIQRWLEQCLDLIAPPLDKLLMKITLRRWERLYKKHYAPEEFRIAFKTKRYVSKNHPRNFQKKVMDAYEKKVAEYTAVQPLTSLR